MENADNITPQKMKPRNAWLGIVLLGAGILLLLRRSGIFIPQWVFTWPMLLIVIGIVIGARRKFRGSAPVILLLVGGFFLIREMGYIPSGLGKYMWPVVIIIIGVMVIIRPRRYRNWNYMGEGVGDSSNVIESVSVFWGVHKNINSKDFRMGEAVNIFGGTNLDFSHADINGKALLEVVNIFGGVKIIVPPTWDVQINVVHIFGGTGDKRPPQLSADGKKILVVTGTVIFGGMDIVSY